MTKKSNSLEQYKAEKSILKFLENKLKLSFDSEAVLPIDINIKPDAIDPINKVIVEVYARIGELKSGQKHKIKGDILKFALLHQKLGTTWRKIICFASDEATKYLQGNSWVTKAAEEFSVEIHTVELSDEEKNSIISAQKRQCMVNK